MEEAFSPALSEPSTNDPLVENTSMEFLGRWHRLVSTTNWEKGRIIVAWREALEAAGAAPATATDEAWSQRVANVTPQHVGRLRRVYERFGVVHEQYPGLYWSHFQATLDWHDAEMWLEGAVQNGWSISQMRGERQQALGVPVGEDVAIVEMPGTESDEEPADDPFSSVAAVQDGPTEAVDEDSDSEPAAEGAPWEVPEVPCTAVEQPVRPFESLATLPADLSQALETLKLAIIHHKLQGWQQVACDDVLAALEGMKQLVTAPSE